MSGAESARDRLQRALVRVDRGGRARSGVPRRHVAPAQAAPAAAPPAPSRGEGAVGAGAPMPAALRPVGEDAEGPAGDLATELLERLGRIEERLADLQRPLRPIPSSREIFSEWVRLRRWEEMPFGEFLKLRRSGLI